MKTKIRQNNLQKDALKGFTREQLIATINDVANEVPSFKQEIEKSANKNKTRFENENNHSKYCSLWDEAEEIISEFNEYGGGPEEKEEVVYSNLQEIVKLFNQGKLSEEAKLEFINNCFEQYYYDNSRFEDLLKDSIFEICNSKKDWLLIIEKLKKSSSDYDAECVMNIYRDKLNDDKTYLKLRMADLHYGTDYYDLVEYYCKKNDIEKAVSIAKEGIEKGEGRIIDLTGFLAEIYAKNKDYKNTLKYNILSFKECPLFEKYNEIRRFCHKTDIDWVSNELKEIINLSCDEELKAKINYLNGDYIKILEYIKDYHGDFCYSDTFKEWAQKIEPYFPKDLLKIYLSRVGRILEYKIAKEYSIAEYYLRRIKLILSNILNNKKEWETLLSSLKQKSLRLPSFQKMLNNLEDEL